VANLVKRYAWSSTWCRFNKKIKGNCQTAWDPRDQSLHLSCWHPQLSTMQRVSLALLGMALEGLGSTVDVGMSERWICDCKSDAVLQGLSEQTTRQPSSLQPWCRKPWIGFERQNWQNAQGLDKVQGTAGAWPWDVLRCQESKATPVPVALDPGGEKTVCIWPQRNEQNLRNTSWKISWGKSGKLRIVFSERKRWLQI
jgi:hypothetical protein